MPYPVNRQGRRGSQQPDVKDSSPVAKFLALRARQGVVSEAGGAVLIDDVGRNATPFAHLDALAPGPGTHRGRVHAGRSGTVAGRAPPAPAAATRAGPPTGSDVAGERVAE